MAKMKSNRLAARVIALALVVCMFAMLSTTAFAAEANKSVTQAKQGVVQIQLWFVDPETAVSAYLQSGTGFLINENTVVTCQHVISYFSDEFYANWADNYNAQHPGMNRTAEDVKRGVEYRVSVLRDVYVKASVRQSSNEMDYAILTLSDRLYDREPLALRASSTLQQTESVYALGFPGDMMGMTDQNFYDADDVTITSGYVNKVDRMNFYTTDGGHYNNVDCVESSALIAGGNSGGPLVDDHGSVVGINAAGNETRNFAVASDQLIKTLNALGIPYTLAEYPYDSEPVATTTTEPATEPAETTAPATETVAPTTEPVPVIAPAETTAPASEPVPVITPAPNAEDEGSNTTLYIIIGAAVAAVLLIVIVVIVVVSNGKKKKAAPAPAPRPAAPVAPVAPATRPMAPNGGYNPNGGFAPVRPNAPMGGMTSVQQDAGATTVLSQGAGETTVLSRAVNGGALIRKRNGERITINTAEFAIGRERKNVTYCISDNNSISRVHVKLFVRNGVTYIQDQNAANGTYVNGNKIVARQDVALHTGDKVTLADEEFEFNA